MLRASVAVPVDGPFGGSDEAVGTGIEDDLSHLLIQAAGLVSAEFREDLRAHGVSGPEWRALSVLATIPGQTVGQLAACCTMQQPTMTKLLERVVRAGLVRRESSPGDRRLVHLRLTPEGESLVATLSQEARRHERRFTARMPVEEVISLKAALRRVIAQADPKRAR